MTTQVKIGLLLGDEDDWPSTIEALWRRMPRTFTIQGETYEIVMERVRIHPFNLRDTTSYHLIIDRLAYWHFNPREWLKKVALLNRVHLLNNPFTFQSMEKHTAYCVMIRLGLQIPDTWLIPAKRGPQGKKYEVTARRYHDLFDLKKIAAGMGYPLFLKPFDGGGWRGVTRVNNEHELMRAYDESGDMIMHLQQGLDNYEVFCRSLAIGPQVMNMHYDPSQPQHGRYKIEHGFLSPEKGVEAMRITKLINAFFRWEFNSCESIIKDGVMHPIDFANACPDIALTSLHYYYPWAIATLYRWSIFAAVTGRRFRLNMNPDDYFAIGDSDRSYEEKLAAYEVLADGYFEKERFEEFCEEHLPMLPEVMYDLVDSAEFDGILVRTVIDLFPHWEHEKFVAHYRGLFAHWLQSHTHFKQPAEASPAGAGPDPSAEAGAPSDDAAKKKGGKPGAKKK